jgi:hypothetical protein
MNSFEQIKALLELKNKGTISDAEFKQMLDILEAESKKEENAGVRSENLEESDDAEELGVRQKDTEQKLKAQAEQTTREIRELVQLGEIEEALITFSNFERKDLFDPKMSQLLNEKKAELELKKKAKNEINRDQELIEKLYEAYRRKDLSTAQIKFDQIKNKDVISSSIKKDLADFEKKKAEEARFDREREERFNKQEQLKKLRQKRQVYSFVIGLALILAFTGYCSNKKSPSNDNESLDTKETTYIENADTLAKSEDDAALKQKFLNHRVIRSNEIQGFQKHFGIVFLQYSEKGDYRKADSERDLNKPESIIKDANLITLLNKQFRLNILSTESDLKKLYNVLSRNRYYTKTFVEFQKQWLDQGYRKKVYHVVCRDGIYTKSEDEFLKKYSYQSPKQIINSNTQEIKKQHIVVEPITRQKQKLNTELSEFPEKFIFEAEKLGRKIWDEKVNSADKKAASKRIVEINQDYVSNQNITWKIDPTVQRRLERCYIVAVNYNQ